MYYYVLYIYQIMNYSHALFIKVITNDTRVQMSANEIIIFEITKPMVISTVVQDSFGLIK